MRRDPGGLCFWQHVLGPVQQEVQMFRAEYSALQHLISLLCMEVGCNANEDWPGTTA